MVKNPPAMHETRVWSLGLEDPLEEEMATHSSILAWKTHGQRSLVAYIMGLQRVRHDWSHWARMQTFSEIERTRGLTFQRRKSRDWEMSGFPSHQLSGFRLWLCHLLAVWCGNNLHISTKTTMHLLRGPCLRACGPFPSLHIMITIFILQMRKFRHIISDSMK